ncbi:MAG: SLC13 family permease [Bacteroidales bacterium]|nr:SLC13 family permease [Bacteroidales bacterium]
MKKILVACVLILLPAWLFAGNPVQIPALFNIRLEFILFGLTLIGVALFHKHTLMVALIGLAAILAFKFIFDPGFNLLEHLFGHNSFKDQILHSDMRQGEWTILLNLLGLLLGFALLSRHFEESEVPDWLPKLLPDNWKGPLILLCMVFVLSSFLDNIAAAMIGGTIAIVVFKGRVHIGYLAGIVAASNAGGSGSVIGDTTTTMMWISGVPAINVLHGYIAAITAFACFAVIASLQQHKTQRIQEDPTRGYKIRWNKLILVLCILIGTILTNILFDFPALGVWIAILVGAIFVRTDWHELRNALPGSIFLLSLVTCASMMPVDQLPHASWQSAFTLGFVSSVFDNIPLTKLALEQGGYDWGMLAYAVGFGGSMIWFGSSAGVAISNKFHEAKSVAKWLANGWHVAIAYVVGFMVLLAVYGWHPEEIVKKESVPATEQVVR